MKAFSSVRRRLSSWYNFRYLLVFANKTSVSISQFDKRLLYLYSEHHLYYRGVAVVGPTKFFGVVKE